MNNVKILIAKGSASDKENYNFVFQAMNRFKEIKQMGYLFKYFSLVVVLLFLSSCGLETLSPKASKQEQEQVKQKVLSMLEKEYNQPFKILGFNYDYKFHYKVSFLIVVGKRYGTYDFKIQAINNPIITVDFIISDNGRTLQWFKENQLDSMYCSYLSRIFGGWKTKYSKSK